MMLQDIVTQISVDPCNEQLYRELLPLLRDESAVDQFLQHSGAAGSVADLCANFLVQYIESSQCSSEIVLDWLDSVVMTDFDQCSSWLERLANNCPSFDCVLKVLDVAQDLRDEERLAIDEARKLFERAVVICGADVFTGSEVWKRYREFEVDEHEDAVQTGAAASDLQKSKERFIKVYVRQLSLPLVGNEETLQEFEEKLGEHCVEADVNLIKPEELARKVAAAKEMREGRLIYEMHLLGGKHDASTEAEKVAFWQGYIAYERKQEQFSRAQRLYERAVMDCPKSATLWLDFVDFGLAVLKSWSLLSNVTRRALLLPSLRSSTHLWKLRLLSMECSGGTQEQVEGALQQALSAGLASVEDYLDLYLACADGQRRKVATIMFQSTTSAQAAEGLTTAIAGLRQALQTCQTFLESYGSEWPAGWWRLCKYQSAIEYRLLRAAEERLQQLQQQGGDGGAGEMDVPDAQAAMAFGSSKTAAAKKGKAAPKQQLFGSDIWELATKRFPGSYFMWSEYIAWAREVGEHEHCRKLYRKVTNLALDVPAADVAREWVRFEEQHGTAPELQAALARHLPFVRAALLAAAETSQSSTTLGQQPPAPSGTTNRATAAASHSQHTSEGKRKRDESTVEVPATPSIDAPAKKVKFAESGSADGAHSAAPASAPAPAQSATAPSTPAELSDTTVVVSNFPFAATLEAIRPMILDKCGGIPTEDIEEAGAQAGAVADVRLLLSKAGHSRGAVEVEFPKLTSDDSVALQGRKAFLQLVAKTLNGYVYNDRALKAEVKSLTAPTPKSQAKQDPLAAQKQAGSLAAPHLTTVFVSGLAPEVTNAQLQEHFSQCGEILAAKVAVDKKTGASKGTGLVQFSNEAGRHAALKLNNSQLRGQELKVLPSRFSLIPVAASASVETLAPLRDESSQPETLRTEGQSDGGAPMMREGGEDQPQTKPAPTETQEKREAKKPSAALQKMATTSFKPRNVPKAAPKGKIQL